MGFTTEAPSPVSTQNKNPLAKVHPSPGMGETTVFIIQSSDDRDQIERPLERPVQTWRVSSQYSLSGDAETEKVPLVLPLSRSASAETWQTPVPAAACCGFTPSLWGNLPPVRAPMQAERRRPGKEKALCPFHRQANRALRPRVRGSRRFHLLSSRVPSTR